MNTLKHIPVVTLHPKTDALQRLLLGSNAAKVVRLSTVPVLTVSGVVSDAL